MKNMKWLVGITGIILIGYTILSATLAPAGGGNFLTNANVALTERMPMYTAREEDDRIVIYAGSRLLARTDTRVSSLPKIDRIRLREGINFSSEKELKRFMEDYCS
ncbi:MAG: hypothetical protein IJ639_06615 [Ruminococcus sp.]|nr:hypothetical protein [Ruminococcus sp.]